MNKKLNQVVAIEKGIKTRTQKTLGDLRHLATKEALFSGHSRTYAPIDSEGETYPDDKVIVQQRVSDVLKSAREALVEQMDIILTKDMGNALAVADVTIDGQKLVSNATVPFLLYLEKELTDIQTFINSLPELDPAEEWSFDEAAQIWKSAVTKSVKTRKIQEVLLLIAPTKEHPGQAKDVTVDKNVGYWHQVKHSGAIPLGIKRKLVDRIHRLLDAVKEARELANMTEVPDVKVGSKIMSWIFD